MANKHIQHVKSNAVNNGSPKLPTIDQILLGEIGINYANGYERMSIKNDANEIVEFVSKEYVVGKNEIDTVVSTAIQQAITANPPTADQEALINAIQNAVSKAIQKTLSSDEPTADQEALINAISDAVTKALQDAFSTIDPTESQEALIKVIYETLTKAIQEALAAENPTVDQKALLKAISDAVAKAIEKALGPDAQDKKIVEQINNIIDDYVYTKGGTSISLTDVMTNSHTHSNKDVLDGITQDKVDSWNNASAGGVTNVAYNEKTKEITKTVGGQTTTVVNLSTLATDMGLEKGSANGVAELDANGKVPSSQLPSYVDDVINGYYYGGKFYKEAAHTTLITGESDKIYVDLSANTTYRCSDVANQTYTQIKGDLALGETSSTAYRGDRGKIAYDHSQTAHARVDATNTEASTTNGNIKINGIETTVYTHPSFTAQTAAAKKVGMNDQGHVVLGDSITKSDVGLGDVGNFKAVSTVANQGLNSTEQSNARANIGAGTSNLAIGTTSTTAAAGNHTHGNISNDGKLTDTAAAAAGNDYVVIRDADNQNIQTSTIKGTDVADAVTNKHTHSNKSVLDSITQENVNSWNNKQDAIEFNTAYDATNNKAATMSDVPKIGTIAGTAFDGADGATAKAETDFLTGSNGTDTNPRESVAGIPVDKRLVRVTISADDSFSLEELPAAGREVHVIVKASADVTISIPSSTSENFYECLNDSTSMSIASGKYGEINVISDGVKAYIRYLGA